MATTRRSICRAVGTVMMVGGTVYTFLAFDSVALRWLGFTVVMLGLLLAWLGRPFTRPDEKWLHHQGIDPD